jgi:hypothetical protein
LAKNLAYFYQSNLFIFSDIPSTSGGVSAVTNSVDIVAEIPKAPETIQKMFKLGTLTPFRGMTPLQGQKQILNWINNDIYYPLYEKKFGFTADSCEKKLLPGKKEARDLMVKIGRKSPQLKKELGDALHKRFVNDNTILRKKLNMETGEDNEEGNVPFFEMLYLK